jgi:hypothetical protein
MSSVSIWLDRSTNSGRRKESDSGCCLGSVQLTAFLAFGRGMFIRAFEQTLARDADFKLGLQIELPDITVVVRPEDFPLRTIRSQGGHHERDASGPHS